MSKADSRARIEEEKAKRAIAAELHVGSSEAEIRAFFARRHWPIYFDDFEQRFYGDVYRAPEKTHTVLAYVYVNKNRELVRSEVHVDITFF